MYIRRNTHGGSTSSPSNLSLLKRRTWYADEPEADGDEPTPEPTPKKTDAERKGDLSTASNEDLLAEIKALRKENAERRKKANELEAWKAEQDAKASQEQDAALLAEKKYQELLDKREKELAEMKAQLAQQAAANLRMKVGVEMKVPAPLISRLQGDTEDALKADAQALIESLGLNQQPQTDEKPQQQPPARRQTTTTVPDGQPPQDSPEARIKARREKTPPIFDGGKVTFLNKSEQ